MTNDTAAAPAAAPTATTLGVANVKLAATVVADVLNGVADLYIGKGSFLSDVTAGREFISAVFAARNVDWSKIKDEVLGYNDSEKADVAQTFKQTFHLPDGYTSDEALINEAFEHYLLPGVQLVEQSIAFGSKVKSNLVAKASASAGAA